MTTTTTTTATGLATEETLDTFRNLALTGSAALKAALATYKVLDVYARVGVVDYLLSDRATASMGKKLTIFSAHEEELEGLDDNATISALNALSTLDDKGFDVRLTKK